MAAAEEAEEAEEGLFDVIGTESRSILLRLCSSMFIEKPIQGKYTLNSFSITRKLVNLIDLPISFVSIINLLEIK